MLRKAVERFLPKAFRVSLESLLKSVYLILFD